MNYKGLEILDGDQVPTIRKVSALARDVAAGEKFRFLSYDVGSSMYDLLEDTRISLEKNDPQYAGINQKMRELIICASILYVSLANDRHEAEFRKVASASAEICAEWRVHAEERGFTSTNFQVLYAALLYVSKKKHEEWNGLIDLQARDRAETEILTLSAELTERAEQGAPSAHHVAKLARKIADAADQLSRET